MCSLLLAAAPFALMPCGDAAAATTTAAAAAAASVHLLTGCVLQLRCVWGHVVRLLLLGCTCGWMECTHQTLQPATCSSSSSDRVKATHFLNPGDAAFSTSRAAAAAPG
jgi:hypothetical protein